MIGMESGRICFELVRVTDGMRDYYGIPNDLKMTDLVINMNIIRKEECMLGLKNKFSEKEAVVISENQFGQSYEVNEGQKIIVGTSVVTMGPRT